MSVFLKDPHAILDYTVDWGNRLLDGETVSSHSWNPDPGIIVTTSTVTGDKYTAFVSGGVVGRYYRLTSRATTNQGRIDDVTIYLKVRET